MFYSTTRRVLAHYISRSPINESPLLKPSPKMHHPSIDSFKVVRHPKNYESSGHDTRNMRPTGGPQVYQGIRFQDGDV